MQDNACLEETNVPAIVDRFIHECQRIANETRGNDIMLTMGTDFTYSNAWTWQGPLPAPARLPLGALCRRLAWRQGGDCARVSRRWRCRWCNMPEEGVPHSAAGCAGSRTWTSWCTTPTGTGA